MALGRIHFVQVKSVLGWTSFLWWTGLATCRNKLWLVTPRLIGGHPRPGLRVAVVVPARNEKEHLRECLTALLEQSFNGELHLVLVNDNSSDATGTIARILASQDKRLRVIEGCCSAAWLERQMWAVSQGLAQPKAMQADFVLLADADILHDSTHFATLVHAAEQGDHDLVSEMLRLRTESLAARHHPHLFSSSACCIPFGRSPTRIAASQPPPVAQCLSLVPRWIE